ncbi:MAG TPA: uracil-DNA glycosylase [Leucothrix sp.]|nr:uracil-DNA glycosylase [Leucothrix sp.]
MRNDVQLEESWLKHIDTEFDQPYMQTLNEFLHKEKSQGKVILPPESLWFNAFNSMAFDKLKVVILGQDPYPTEGHAHGLCFSVLPEVKPLPKSLLNINKELLEDLGIDNSHTGCLQSWAEQGVLLLNTALTVEQGNANSHQGKGWETFTDKVIQTVNHKKEHIVFILWGANAHKKIPMIDNTKHLIIKSVHPSPLSAYRGFFGSKPFSKTNDFLQEHGIKAIHWQL